MKKLNPRAGYNPKTAARPQNRPTRPVLSNAATTSADAQRLIRQSPAYPTLKPVPTNPSYRALRTLAGFAKSTVDRFRTVSVKSKPTVNLGAVGEPRLPRGYNSINSGRPTSAQRVIGGGNQPRATAKQRSQYPGIFGRTPYRP